MTERDLINAAYNEALNDVMGVRVEAIPAYTSLPTDVKMTKLPVLFNVVTGSIVKLRRDPVHICVALDRSGSMQGKPFANCKIAIKTLINMLKVDDRISLLVYDHGTDVVFDNVAINKSDEQASQFHKVIDALQTRGSTDISKALEKSIELLSSTSPDTKRVVFLFSDGDANIGITDVDELGKMIMKWSRDDFFFSAFGIGTYYNEKLMLGVARCGGGAYSFVDKVSDTEKYVTKAIRMLNADMYKDAGLLIHGLNGAKVVPADDSEKALLEATNGFEWSVLKERNVLQNLVEFDISGAKVTGDDLDLGTYELTYSVVDGIDAPTPVIADKISVPIKDGKLELAPQYKEYVALKEAAELELKVNDAVEKGDHNAAVAAKVAVVEKYKTVRGMGGYQRAEMLQLNAEEACAALKVGINERSTKMQSSTSSYACRAVKMKRKNYHKTQIFSGEDADVEDVEGAFGLYD